MIYLPDTLILVYTKFRTRHLRLAMTVIVSALMCSLIFGALMLFDGVSHSITQFNKLGLGERYLIKGSAPPDFSASRVDVADPTLIGEMKNRQNDYIKKKEKLAKELAVPYDSKLEPPLTIPNPNADPSLPESARIMLNESSPVVMQYARQRYEEVRQHTPAMPHYKSIATSRGATATYELTQLNGSFQALMPGGKEPIEKLSSIRQRESQEQIQARGRPTSISTPNYSLIDDSLVRMFILPKSERKETDALPVLVPISDVIREFSADLKLTKKPRDAQMQIAWMQDLYKKVNGHTYSVCYRNNASQTLLDTAIKTDQDIATHKNDKDYQEPPLQYALPAAESCGPATIKKDVRTTTEKQADAAKEQFAKAFDEYEEPRQQKMTYQIIGVLPDVQDMLLDNVSGLQGMMQFILSPSLPNGSLIPISLYNALPDSAKYTDILQNTRDQRSAVAMMANGEPTYVAEFPTASKARAFRDAYSCDIAQANKCPDDKPFILSAFGSSFLVVDDFIAYTRPIFYIVLAVLGVIATIIIWSMVGRMISDSRRETAVFRAIGAKRIDIASIYILYTLLVALQIIIVAVVIAVTAVLTLNVMYGHEASIYATIAYGVFTSHSTFSFLGFGLPYTLYVALGVFGISLVALLIPLLRNIRRNPINDMREE